MLENVHPWPLQPPLTEFLTALHLGFFFFFHVNLQSHNPAKYLLSVKSMWCEQNILRG